MLTALSLLVVSGRTWQKVADRNRGLAFTFFVSLLPLMALSSLVEGYSLARWGKKTGEFGGVLRLSSQQAVQFEMLQIGLGLILIFGGGKITHWLGRGFEFERNYSDCFTLVAYGLTPIFLARILNALPAMNSWVCWAAGAFGVMLVLYQGVGWVLKPSPTKGFGLYLLNGLVLVVLSGVCQLIAQTFLSRMRL